MTLSGTVKIPPKKLSSLYHEYKSKTVQLSFPLTSQTLKQNSLSDAHCLCTKLVGYFVQCLNSTNKEKLGKLLKVSEWKKIANGRWMTLLLNNIPLFFYVRLSSLKVSQEVQIRITIHQSCNLPTLFQKKLCSLFSYFNFFSCNFIFSCLSLLTFLCKQ